MKEKSHHGSRKRFRKLVMSLAVVVVFVTTYALVLPALTLDEQKADETPGIDTGTKAEQSVDATGQDSSSGVSEESGSAFVLRAYRKKVWSIK